MNKILSKIYLFFGINSKKTSLSHLSISLTEKINLLDQLSNLLNSGINLTNGLKIILYQTRKKKLRDMLSYIIDKTNKGISLKETISNYPHIFNNFDISIIEMGELTGKLGDSIETIKIKEEKNKELKGKIIGALIYPIVIIILSFSMILIFMIYVIPQIEDMYSDSKVNLPTLTQKVIDISNFFQNNLILIIIGIILFVILLIYLKNNSITKYYFDYYVLKTPIFGKLIKKKILSLLTSSLGILLKNGVIINKSLEVSSHALENSYYERKLTFITSQVSKGVELSKLFGVEEITTSKENFLFPIELASIVKIGEQTGKMPDLLLKISKKYNKEIDNIVKNLQTAIEPVVIIVVGIIVGVLIMAIMLPFFNMVNVI